MAALLTVDKVNNLDYPEFTAKFGNVIEHNPVIAAGIWSMRPFSSVQDIHSKISSTIDQLPFHVKEGILRCHPDLAGSLAASGQLSQESTSEQHKAGLLGLSPSEQKYLAEHNDKYKQKFGFPFVICVRENKKQAIMEGVSTRLHNSLKEEVNIGIEQVKKIGYLRLCDIVTQQSDHKL